MAKINSIVKQKLTDNRDKLEELLKDILIDYDKTGYKKEMKMIKHRVEKALILINDACIFTEELVD